FVDRYNADLANDFGNLASRALKMLAQYTSGAVPPPGEDLVGEELAAIARELPGRLEARMDGLDFSGALQDTWRLVDRANKYVEESKPWELRKAADGEARLNAVLYNLAESLRVLTYAVFPFIPSAAAELARQLDVTAPADVAPGGPALAEVLAWGGLKAGHQTTVGPVLFPRLDRATVLAAE
ncbi:MAG: methionyl-tRNA synthetase, partial [Chloroflexota bacterium]|nr:methionyl-tRNA synthetase [Chloroflexota bacterium]